MHDDREVQCTRQLHLAGEYNLLPRTRTLVFFPVIVKTNFADGANLAFVLCQCADGLQMSLPAVLDVLRVNTDRRIYKWIFIRVADRLARAFHITAGIENQADIVLGHGSRAAYRGPRRTVHRHSVHVYQKASVNLPQIQPKCLQAFQSPSLSTSVVM